MSPLHQLESWLLQAPATDRPCLYRANDFRALFPELSAGAYRAVLHRAQHKGILERVCQGIYQYAGKPDTSGYILFHAAALLRAQHFNYISLETALSDAGVISQIPMGWITLVSTGRTATVACGRFGTIEFLHTQQPLAALQDRVAYDAACHMFRANTDLARQDMARFNRHATADLIVPPENAP